MNGNREVRESSTFPGIVRRLRTVVANRGRFIKRSAKSERHSFHLFRRFTKSETDGLLLTGHRRPPALLHLPAFPPSSTQEGRRTPFRRRNSSLRSPPTCSGGQGFRKDAGAKQVVVPRESDRLWGLRLGAPHFWIPRNIESGSHRFVRLALAGQGRHSSSGFRRRSLWGGSGPRRVTAFRGPRGGDQSLFHVRLPPHLQGCCD